MKKKMVSILPKSKILLKSLLSQTPGLQEGIGSKYRVSHSKHLYFNLLWWIEFVILPMFLKIFEQQYFIKNMWNVFVKWINELIRMFLMKFECHLPKKCQPKSLWMTSNRQHWIFLDCNINNIKSYYYSLLLYWF